MRNKLISTLIALSSAIALASPAAAGDRYHHYRGDNDRAIGFIAGFVLGKALSGGNHRYVAPRDRYYGGTSGYRQSERLSRRLSGRGERVGAGDYCPYRLAYNQWSGRYICVR